MKANKHLSKQMISSANKVKPSDWYHPLRTVFIFFAILLGFVGISVTNVLAAAAIPSPITQLQNMSNEALTELNRGNLTNQQLLTLLRRIAIPNSDVQSIGHSVIGNYWATATVQQRNTLVDEISSLLVNLYSSALKGNSHGAQIKFLPLREPVNPNKLMVIRSVLTTSGGVEIPMNYVVRYSQATGKWLVLDMQINNISLVRSYRAQFQPILQQSGVAGLIQRLQKTNTTGK